METHLPDKKGAIIPAFQQLSEKIGPEKVIWRYDPILVNDRYSIDYHINAFVQIAEALDGYTEKCVFSFVDTYAKNISAMQSLGVRDLTPDEMCDMAIKIRDIAKERHMVVATCAEEIDLDELGIEHNACIDKALIEKITGGKIKDIKKIIKDAGQREACRCMASKEIGAHNSCGNGCVYCYANYSPDSVKKHMAKYDPKSPILCDVLGPDEQVKDASDMKPLVIKDGQMSLF